MDNIHRFTIEDLQKLCDEREEETSRLEFKPCNELKIGTPFRDKKGDEQTRQRDDVLRELTKDVTAFLNSAGGIIIYGIQESKSRAKKIDKDNSFKASDKQDNVKPEKIIDWLRDHVQPSPTVDVYSVFEEPDDPESSWYLVIEIPQGLLAYMAKDGRFYKRIGSTAQPMEQYEVVDVMNRTRAAALSARVTIEEIPYVNEKNSRLHLKVILTSENFIASEYGQIEITLAYPIKLEPTSFDVNRENLDFEKDTGLLLEGYQERPHANRLRLRWGTHDGRIIFPGAMFDIYHDGNLYIQIPKLSLIPNPTYLFQIELFTMNSRSKKALFAIQQQPNEDAFKLTVVDASISDRIKASFWETYHQALRKFTEVYGKET